MTDAAAALLVGSPLFDPVWYAEVAGCDRRPAAAARHYLRRGARRGLHPHPLFATEHVLAGCPSLAEGGDALVGYLTQQRFDVATHPLFDLRGYTAANPAAATHPLGPLGHYLEVGAPAGLAPNDWYQPHEGEPRGLVDWVVARQREWQGRRRLVPKARTRRPPTGEPTGEPTDEPTDEPTGELADSVPQPVRTGPNAGPSAGSVSVIIEAGTDRAALDVTVGSVLAQDVPAHDLIVVATGDADALRHQLGSSFPEAPLTVLSLADAPGPRASIGLNRAARQATGDHLAWAAAGDVWAPGRLRRLLAACTTDGTGGCPSAVCDVMRVVRPGKHDQYAAASPTQGRPTSPVTAELGRLLVARSAFSETGGFDEQLPAAWEPDFVHRLASRFAVRAVPVVGTTRAVDAEGAVADATEPVLDHAGVSTWADVAFNRYAVDWDDLARRDQRADLVTVVVTATGWRQVVGCVRQVHAAGAPAGRALECLVVDDGSHSLTSQVLSSLETRFDGVRVVHLPSPHGSSLSSNLALPEVHGSVVVWLSGEVRVQPGWLGPLVDAVERPDVLGAQSLVTSPTGSIRSAGFAFPSCGGLPYEFLHGFPAADAAGLDDVPLSALSRTALALRYDDLVTLHGFDPLFRGGLEDVDLCLRLLHERRGHFVLAPDSRVSLPARSRGGRRSAPAHAPDRAAESPVPALNRELFLDRWEARTPRDDSRLWASRGFDVHSYVTVPVDGMHRRLCAPRPVVSRPRVSVRETAPRLRWALKVASPAGERRELWGDTHFARSLGGALRDLGQQVVVDHREDFDRHTGHYDDVVLVLRGLESFEPAYGQVNLAWVISHPELLLRREAASYDRVLAASNSWAAKMSQRWSMRIDPLLQATDPELFHPDRGRTDEGDALVFVGGSRQHYRQIVRHSVVSGLPLSVYGSDWEELIPPHLIKGTFVPNRDLGALYASAGVVLNDHWEDMRREGFLSNRLFDAVASGARVISDDVAGLDGMFENSVQVATDAASLTRLVRHDPLDHTFGTDEERRRVAGRVHREHSFHQRAKRLLDVAMEVRHQQATGHPQQPLGG